MKFCGLLFANFLLEYCLAQSQIKSSIIRTSSNGFALMCEEKVKDSTEGHFSTI